eukprot:m.73655 g.73655  ORF g.73655 m.73655 type:complete len:502 (-) comp12429_c0_seq3:96-1601(-)
MAGSGVARERRTATSEKKPKKSTGSNITTISSSYSISISLIVAVATILLGWQQLKVPVSDSTLSPLPAIGHRLEQVPRITVQKTEQFVDKVTKLGKPVVITGSFVQDWSAIKAKSQWTPRRLKHKLKGKRIEGIYGNSYNYFGPYYDSTRPLVKESPRPNHYKTNHTLPSSEFLTIIENEYRNSEKNDNKYPFVYLSTEIDKFDHGEGWGVKDMLPFEEFLRPMPERSSINVWLGSTGVLTHCHYDGYHNFYVQVYGRKRFWLFSPSQESLLHPYSYLHPCHAQCQVNLSQFSESNETSEIENIVGYETILEPGDVMYLPPLWFHHVQALSPSVSINVWTDTQQTEIAESLFSIPWPSITQPVIEKAKNEYWRKWVYLYLLGSATKRDDTNKEQNFIVQNLLTSRYQYRYDFERDCSLMDDFGLLDTFSKHMSQQENKKQVLQFSSAVQNVVEQLPKDTVALWFGNWIEYTAATKLNTLKVAQELAPLAFCPCRRKLYASC